jgi:deoxyribose-phosphate aldolase
LGIEELELTTGAVCVYHAFVETAVKALEGTKIHVAAVSTGFPAGLSPLAERVQEIRRSVEAGAQEIDIVITREHVLTGDWRALYAEVRDFRAACGNAHLKTILATGDLKTLRNVAKASMVCMIAGADFIKTSTGKEGVNATLPVTLAMLRMIRVYQERTGYKIGFKPAGGISTAKDVLNYQFLMKEELGRDWLEPVLFRVGASSLLADIERQLEHHVTGRYSAFNRHPVG